MNNNPHVTTTINRTDFDTIMTFALRHLKTIERHRSTTQEENRIWCVIEDLQLDNAFEDLASIHFER